MPLIETQPPDGLEADIRKLHDYLLELSRIECARHTWVSAGSAAAELGRILAKKERRSGEGPDPAQNKSYEIILTERGVVCNGKCSADHHR